MNKDNRPVFGDPLRIPVDAVIEERIREGLRHQPAHALKTGDGSPDWGTHLVGETDAHRRVLERLARDQREALARFDEFAQREATLWEIAEEPVIDVPLIYSTGDVTSPTMMALREAALVVNLLNRGDTYRVPIDQPRSYGRSVVISMVRAIFERPISLPTPRNWYQEFTRRRYSPDRFRFFQSPPGQDHVRDGIPEGRGPGCC